MTLRDSWDNFKWRLQVMDLDTIGIIAFILLMAIAVLTTLWVFDWDWRCLLVECVITKP